MLACACLALCCGKRKKADPPPAPTEIVTDAAVEIPEVQPNNSLNYLGTYKGVLPCPDCRGIETSIELSEDFSYIMHRRHLGKEEKPTEMTGAFSWNSDDTAIVLDNQLDMPNQYLVGDNALTQLDMDGRVVTGSAAAAYVLHKIPESVAGRSDAKPGGAP